MPVISQNFTHCPASSCFPPSCFAALDRTLPLVPATYFASRSLTLFRPWNSDDGPWPQTLHDCEALIFTSCLALYVHLRTERRCRSLPLSCSVPQFPFQHKRACSRHPITTVSGLDIPNLSTRLACLTLDSTTRLASLTFSPHDHVPRFTTPSLPEPKPFLHPLSFLT